MKLRVLFFLVLILSGALPANAVEQGACSRFAPLTFGILPFVSARQLVMRFTPLANYLTDSLNAEIRIETAPDFVEFARRTHEQQRYDILFTAPHFYPRASEAGYRLIVSVDSPGMWAVIVVPKQSSIKKLDDLRGKRLAILPEKSLASLLLRKYLREQGILPDKDLELVITPTHDASLLSSYHGVTDASALMQPPFAAASSRVRESMRVIARTERAPHIPISVSSRISDDCAREISGLLLAMPSTAQGRTVLEHNRFSGFRKATAQEYENISKLMR